MTNYFLRHEGKYCNEKVDKKIWVLWAEGRIHGEYDAVKSPIGYLPRFNDLNKLFREVFGKEYKETDYNIQFSVRLEKILERIARMEALFKVELGIPAEFWKILNQQKMDVEALRDKTGQSELLPSYFA